jgi:uncharacterized protein YbaR (Trm112 family)
MGTAGATLRRTGPPKVLLDRLACPECRAPLFEDGDASLCCSADGEHLFPVVDDVPLLLRAAERETLYPDLEQAALMRREYRRGVVSTAVGAAKKLIGSTLHLPLSSTVRRVWKESGAEPALEVGSGVSRGGPNRVNLDIGLFPNVDVVGSALRLPFLAETFGLVRSEAVLEHVREPRTMIDEMLRVLRPGGHLYTEVPFLQHFHAYPNDFQRYTVEGLRQAFSDFEVVETGVCVGPCSALTALIADWVELWTFSHRRWLNDLVRTVPLIALLPLKYLDYVMARHPRAHELASGLYILARKGV